MRKLFAAVCLLLAACTATPPPEEPTGPYFSTTFRPVAENGEVIAIDVATRVVGPEGKTFGLMAPIVYPGSTGVVDRMTNLTVADREGALPLKIRNDPRALGGFPYFRHFTATRDVVYPVTVTYRALVQPKGSPSGPPFGIRPSGGGVSGAGSTFIMIPEGIGNMPATVRWDLSGLPPGSIGVASFGEGEQVVSQGPAQLWQAWYLAGPAPRYPAEGGDAQGFSAAWLGKFPFDAQAEMQWAGKLYAYLGKSFAYLDPPPRYRVFMRYLETPPIGGGTALNNSFMLSTGVGGKDTKPRATFAHEMIHMWVGGIEGPDGVTSWFSEGLTTYYTALLPARGGFFTPEEQAAQITAIAKGYWAAPARNWSAAKIAEAGFTDEITRHVPYNRSALYFADLDAKIYAKSKGERRLIDMLQPMFEYRNKGSKFTQAAWVAMLTLELGPEAEKQFKNVIIDGKDITPVADAFGPCFERRERVYDADKESVVGYEWVRKRGVEEDTCREW
ncbi:MAG TPA: hypothetical protein VGO52_09010 [Hyphomonadaceae bacterium]|jgi:hypothetical protein|nr:hypothetical protein [Hyphomonadaceae bacterium]